MKKMTIYSIIIFGSQRCFIMPGTYKYMNESMLFLFQKDNSKANNVVFIIFKNFEVSARELFFHYDKE